MNARMIFVSIEKLCVADFAFQKRHFFEMKELVVKIFVIALFVKLMILFKKRLAFCPSEKSQA